MMIRWTCTKGSYPGVSDLKFKLQIKFYAKSSKHLIREENTIHSSLQTL